MVEGHHTDGLQFNDAKAICRSAEGVRADLAAINSIQESG